MGSHIKEGYRERDPRLLRTKPWLVDGFILKSSLLCFWRETRKQQGAGAKGKVPVKDK